MMTKKYSIIAFGEPLIEVMLDRPPTAEEINNQTRMACFLRSKPIHATSGDVLNFIGNYIALSNYVKKTSDQPEHIGLLTTIGNDSYGQKIKQTVEKLTNNGVDPNLITLAPNSQTGVYGVYVIDNSGKYQFYFDRFGYAFEKALSSLTFDSMLKTASLADYFYTSGIALMMTNEYGLFPILFEKLADYKTLVVFDTNFRKAVFDHANIPDIRSLLEKIYKHTSILLAGEEDIRNLYPEFKDIPTNTLVEKYFALVENSGLPKNRIIVKCSEKGVYWFDNTLKNRSIYRNNLNDCENNSYHPEGAGDAFNAGFMFALIRGKTTEKSIDFGLRVASRIVRFKGCYRGVLPFEKDSGKLFQQFHQ